MKGVPPVPTTVGVGGDLLALLLNVASHYTTSATAPAQLAD